MATAKATAISSAPSENKILVRILLVLLKIYYSLEERQRGHRPTESKTRLPTLSMKNAERLFDFACVHVADNLNKEWVTNLTELEEYRNALSTLRELAALRERIATHSVMDRS